MGKLSAISYQLSAKHGSNHFSAVLL